MSYDLLVVGGGINGCAIAREAALNGQRVLLVESDDIGAHTSSASSRLIHGGLRYLEYYEFRLVREALQERERLLKAAPHLIRPLEFVVPQHGSQRPAWMMRAGLMLYDMLARSSMPRSRKLGPQDRISRLALRTADKGYAYWDAWTDDSRLTLSNALDAADLGAEIRTRSGLASARRVGELWEARLETGETVRARAIVNAAGPWVGELLNKVGITTKSKVRLVKGSHITVNRLYHGRHAYLLQQPDRRVVFALNYDTDYTTIGTTDVPVDDPRDPVIDDAEIDYLLEAANRHFRYRIGRHNIVHSWSGIRALYDDGAKEARAVTRDYVLELDEDGPAALSVFGGKITTARALAEDAITRLAPVLGIEKPVTSRDRSYPGGDIHDFNAFLERVRGRFPFLGDSRSLRMARAYGTRLFTMLDDVRSEAAMGRQFGDGLSEVEAKWMRAQEWAITAEDALMRRSKCAIHMTEAEREEFARWWDSEDGAIDLEV
ncbi:glycerol-3-phosphate dehydrogenase [Stakelama sp. CBK3Z-3]|uniref:Glycerol-3-phosphate dehydrogenase n=1 Tax=Stakelama flava TaxID=2860338 RepID=A0ABS6XNS5_9SPHN|nr:glycerol-3-phosphate dehydrogenase [Stakelama flava]MBW4331867.1 glycerol-3-phosphate dehydrogenase [Stakelama flava]